MMNYLVQKQIIQNNAKPREPRILSDEEIEKVENGILKMTKNKKTEEFEVMKFPRDNATYGKQNTYICDKGINDKGQDFKYPE